MGSPWESTGHTWTDRGSSSASRPTAIRTLAARRSWSMVGVLPGAPIPRIRRGLGPRTRWGSRPRVVSAIAPRWNLSSRASGGASQATCRAVGAEPSPAFSPNVPSSGGSSFPGKTPIEGPWRFHFELENHGGTGWRGEVSDRTAGVTVTLHRLVVSPTLIRAWVSWSGDPLRASEDDVWSTSATLVHDGERFGPGGGGSTGDRGEIDHPARLG